MGDKVITVLILMLLLCVGAGFVGHAADIAGKNGHPTLEAYTWVFGFIGLIVSTLVVGTLCAIRDALEAIKNAKK
jgi:hypothetical protein